MRRLWPLLLLAVAAAQEPEEDPIAFVVGGTVAGPDDAPLPGAAVAAWDAVAPERFLGETVTGAKGSFLLALHRSAVERREHPFGPVRLVVSGEGIARTRVDVDAGARDVRIAAPASRAVRGIVVDAEGKPVPGVIVRGRTAAGAGETTTDELGRFVLAHFAADEAVELDAWRDDVAQRAAGTAKGDAAVLLVLPAPRRRHGVVQDGASGAPVAGARLVTAEGRVAGVTGDGGAFDVADTPDALYVQAPGYFVRPLAGAETPLEPAPPVAGRVVDADDRPVESCLVSVTGDGVRLAARTDEFGRFAFDIVPPGLVTVAAEARGRRPAAARIVTGGAGDEITLRLLPGATLAGRVLREGGPALGARVAAFDADGAEVAVAYADADGRFLLPGVDPAARRLRATRGDEAAASVALPDLAQGARAGPFVLELKDHLPLQGTLVGDAGAPLAGVEIACAGRKALTDAEGRFFFESVPARAVEVEAHPARHEAVRARARPGLPLRLEAVSRFGELALVVEVAAGPPYFEVALRRREEPRVRRRGTGDRATPHVRFAGLPPGAYDLEVSATGFLPAARAVTLAGAETKVDVALERGGTLTLKATPGASVAVFALEGREPPLVALKLATGAQTLRDFGPGRYRFLSRAPGELVVVKEIELSPSTPPAELDLRGGAASTLVVEVKDAAGDPVAGAQLTLVAEGGFERNVARRTDAAGRVEVDHLFQGRMEIRASAGDRLGAAALDVEPAQALHCSVVVR